MGRPRVVQVLLGCAAGLCVIHLCLLVPVVVVVPNLRDPASEPALLRDSAAPSCPCLAPPAPAALVASRPKKPSPQVRRTIGGVKPEEAEELWETWEKQGSGCLHVLWDDKSMLASAERLLGPRAFAQYLLVREGIEKADVFKYLLARDLGGVVADWDVRCASPVARWWNASAAGASGGALLVASLGRWGSSLVVQNWAFGATRNHTVARDALEAALGNVESERAAGAAGAAGAAVPWARLSPREQSARRTGVFVWTAAVERHIGAYGMGLADVDPAQVVRVGDVVFVPERLFAAEGGEQAGEAYVVHVDKAGHWRGL
eukprot:m51a1_g6309 hypothetical protein (318) ;mRNA; r:321356-322397